MNWFAWALLSAAFAGLTAILAKMGVAEINSHLATALRTSVVLVFTWSVVLVSARPADWCAITLRDLIFLVLSGVTTGLSWLCYFRALQLGDVSKVAPIDKLSVAIALLLAVLFLGERLSMQEIAGVALMIGGALIVAWK